MAKPLGLFLRGGVYSLRTMIPNDLRPAYGGRGKVIESLGTRNRHEADRLAAERRAVMLADFDAKRRELHAQPLTRVTPELSAILAERVRAAVLAQDDAVRGNQLAAYLMAFVGRSMQEAAGPPRYLSDPPPPPPDLWPDRSRDALQGLTAAQAEGLALANALLEGSAAQSLARQNLAAVVGMVDAEARKLGLRFDARAPGARDALAASLRAFRTARADVTRRDRGDIVETPDAPTLPAAPRTPVPTATGRTIRDAFESWRDSDPDRPQKTIAAYADAADRFESLLPGRTLESLGRADGVALTTALLRWADEGGKSRTTAAKLLGHAKTLLAHAADVEWIEKNPLQGRSIEKAESSRRPWSDTELARLFDAPLFTRYELPRLARAGGDAAYWLPLVGLFTGARITELAQLWTDDVAETSEAGLVLTLRVGEDRAQALKNKGSARTIPVHPELVRLGFASYWQAMCRHGIGPLWPAVRLSTANGAGSKVSQWFGEFKTAQGFDAALTFHSFRHTVRTRLAAAGVSESHIDALIGHAGKGEGQRTYTHLTAAHLRPTVERLVYPSLALPRVFTTPAWRPAK